MYVRTYECTRVCTCTGEQAQGELVGKVGALDEVINDVNLLCNDHSEMWRQYQGLPMNQRRSHTD